MPGAARQTGAPVIENKGCEVLFWLVSYQLVFCNEQDTQYKGNTNSTKGLHNYAQKYEPGCVEGEEGATGHSVWPVLAPNRSVTRDLVRFVE